MTKEQLLRREVEEEVNGTRYNVQWATQKYIDLIYVTAVRRVDVNVKG